MLSAVEFLAQQQAPSGRDAFLQFLPIILLFGAMYFFMIAPQRKKQKEHEKMLAALQPGDEVLTSGGIFGTITKVRDDRFEVRVADNTKVEIGKPFVQTVLKAQGAATADKK